MTGGVATPPKVPLHAQSTPRSYTLGFGQVQRLLLLTADPPRRVTVQRIIVGRSHVIKIHIGVL
jgi:hypothetical protein